MCYLKASLHTLQGSILGRLCALEFLGELKAWVPPRGGCNWHGCGPGGDSVEASQMDSVDSQGGDPLLWSHALIPKAVKGLGHIWT